MNEKGEKKCGKCADELPKSGDHVICTTCNSGYHYGRCSVKEKTWKALGENKEKWVCTNCRIQKRGNLASEETSEFLTSNEDEYEVSSLGISKSISQKIDQLLETKVKIDSIEKSMSFLANKYDELLNEFKLLSEENKTLRNDIAVLKKHEVQNNSIIQDLQEKVAELDQYGRRMNLEIHGIAQEADEKLPELLKEVAQKIGVQHLEVDIHRAHRLQNRRDGKPSTILVQFMSAAKRDEWLRAGKKARLQRIYFNENLCPTYRTLLMETKQRARAHNYSYVWFQGGKILVRKKEDDRQVLVVKSFRDLRKIGLAVDS